MTWTIGYDSAAEGEDYTVISTGLGINIQSSPLVPPNQIVIHQGNTVAPAYTFSNDSSTGFYHAGNSSSRRKVLIKDLTTGKSTVGHWVTATGVQIVIGGYPVGLANAGDILTRCDQNLEVPFKDYEKFFQKRKVYKMKKGKEEKLFTVEGWRTDDAKSIRIFTKEISNLEAVEIQAKNNE